MKKAEKSQTKPKTRNSDKYNGILASTSAKSTLTSDGSDTADSDDVPGLYEAEIELTNYYNYNYVGILEIGNPPQEVRAIFDTGSTNQWVLSTLCDSPCCHDGSNEVFNPDISSTFEMTNIGVEIEFGSGCLQGYFGYDDFWVGGGENHSKIHVQD